MSTLGSYLSQFRCNSGGRYLAEVGNGYTMQSSQMSESSIQAEEESRTHQTLNGPKRQPSASAAKEDSQRFNKSHMRALTQFI